jgi:Holliday junction DNA helicase RuvA
MIASVRGTLAERGTSAVVIEAGGVGYLVQVSSHTLRALPERGATVFLRTRQVVREDALQLFGFASGDELRLFDLLITVSGVGPRLALTLLSGFDPSALTRAIRDERVAALTSVPGIGRKTAERLIVDLRDKLDAPPTPAAADGGVLKGAASFDDAVAALTRLGYTAAQARDALRPDMEGEGERSVEDLVRRALSRLGKALTTSR